MPEDFFTIVAGADALASAWEDRIDALADRVAQQRLTWDSDGGEIDVSDWAADLLAGFRSYGDPDTGFLKDIGWGAYWSHGLPLMTALYEFVEGFLGPDAASVLRDAWADLCGWSPPA
jgi:hypothetical protein